MPSGWGAIAFFKLKDCPPAATIRGEVPSDILQRFCSRRAYIYFLEAWAQVLIGIGFADMLGDAYTTFCDNEAAKHALLKGYGKDISINNMLGMFWTGTARSGQQPWIERVSSKANLSDGVSRNDLSVSDDAGWFHIQLDLDNVYKTLLRASSDMNFAHTEAASVMYEDISKQVRQQLVNCPWEADICWTPTSARTFDGER
jgi:hypothetical protein